MISRCPASSHSHSSSSSPARRIETRSSFPSKTSSSSSLLIKTIKQDASNDTLNNTTSDLKEAKRFPLRDCDERRRRDFIRTGSLAIVCSLFLTQQSFNAKSLALEANEQAENEFVQKLLKRTEAKLDERKIERLEQYSKKNFRDYLAFVDNGKTKNLSENDKKIKAYLERTKE